MKMLQPLVALVLLVASMSTFPVTFEELGDSLKEPITPRSDEGVVRSIDMVTRTIVIGGYEYLVGPATIDTPVKVSLYGTTAGAFEMLTAGMKVEVQYVDFGHARVAFEIKQLAPDADVEH